MVSKREYFLPAASNTQNVEDAVNKILAQHPNAKITLLNPVSGIYCDRRLEMQCPKCASKVHQTGNTYTCESCKRAYTQSEFEQHAQQTYAVKGSLYMQAILVEEG